MSIVRSIYHEACTLSYNAHVIIYIEACTLRYNAHGKVNIP